MHKLLLFSGCLRWLPLACEKLFCGALGFLKEKIFNTWFVIYPAFVYAMHCTTLFQHKVTNLSLLEALQKDEIYINVDF